MSDNPTSELARFASDFEFDEGSRQVRSFVADLFLDTVASGLAGRHGEETAQLESLARTLGGEGSSTVFGSGELSLIGAVLLNGYQITAVTVCDIHRPLLCHVTPGVFPAALAVAERYGATGRQVMDALVIGLESSVRVGNGLNYPAFRARGWHSPGVIGPFGGAAAVGRLLGLDAAAMVNAFGLAGSQSAGTFAAWGTPTVKWHQSRGGASGLMSGLLAAEGFKASSDILTAPDGGLVTTYSDGGSPAAFTDRLGDRWDLQEIALRRWPVASSLQGVVTALLELIEEVSPRVEEIASVRVSLSETVFDMHGLMGWQDMFRARLSTKYVTSVVLHARRCWLEEFLPDRIRDPQLTAFAQDKVEVAVDASVPDNGAIVEIATADGKVHTKRREVPKGDPQDSLRRKEIEEKFHDAREGILGDTAAEAFLDALDRIEELESIEPLLAPLRVPSVAPGSRSPSTFRP